MAAFRLGTYLSELALKGACYKKDEELPSTELGLRGLNVVADLEAKQCPVQHRHLCLVLGGLAALYINTCSQGLAACSAACHLSEGLRNVFSL